MPRRTLRVMITAMVALTITACLSGNALAQQKYPAKPIRLIVSFTAGGTPDTLARLLGPRISESLGQPIVIENRPGAGGALAAAIVAKAPADGYTLLAASPGYAINAALSPNLPYDAAKDFSGVANIGYSTVALVVSPTLGPKSVKELIALGHSLPGKFFFGSAGAGSGTHMNAERFRIAANIKAVHVAFKGQPEFLIEIVAGRVHYGVAGLGPAMSLIKENRLLPLAVLPQRTPLFPDVPALSEILPGAARDGFQLWLAPAGTPISIRQQLNREMARVLALPEVKERLLNVAFQIHHSSPEETERLLRADIASFTKLATDAGMRAK
jgi:tripartite-type tricarboxylate transporter receptor subunit TctC